MTIAATHKISWSETSDRITAECDFCGWSESYEFRPSQAHRAFVELEKDAAAHLADPGHGMRERAVPCAICRCDTWNCSAICDPCSEATNGQDES